MTIYLTSKFKCKATSYVEQIDCLDLVVVFVSTSKIISNFPPACHSLMTCVKYLLLSDLNLNCMVLINTYRPPNSSRESFEEIVNKIRSCIGEMSTPLCDIIMLGDFNFPLIDWQSTVISSTHANSLLDLTNFLYLDQLVQLPTRGANVTSLI